MILMKKLLALFLALTMILCGACTAAPAAPAAPAAEAAPAQEPAAPAEPATEAPAAPALKVGVLLEGSLGDDSINDQANAGLQKVIADFGVEGKYIECSDSSVYADAVANLCDNGYNVVVCDSFSFAEALQQVAPLYPEVDFMILDTTVDVDNVTSFMYATHEVSFLTGIAAAMTSKTGVIGAIGGMDIGTIQKYMKGYEEGAHYVNPDCTVLVKYIGNDGSAWNDPVTAKSLTLDEIANGADVVFQVAGASGLGTIAACAESDVWAVGVNVDQSHNAPEHVLTSALTRGDVAIYLFVESIINGEKLTGLTILNCANGGVGLVESEFLSQEILDKVDEATKKIISGEIVVTNVLGQ